MADSRDDDIGGERVARAFHDAGHAVAVALRDGSAGPPEGARAGEAACPGEETPQRSRPFIAYAGPWAVARQRWALAAPTGEDRCGLTFEDYVTRELLGSAGDAMTVAMAELEIATLIREGGADEEDCWRWLRGIGYAWRRELEDVWDVVRLVADRRLGGADVPAGDVRRLTDERLASLYP